MFIKFHSINSSSPKLNSEDHEKYISVLNRAISAASREEIGEKSKTCSGVLLELYISLVFSGPFIALMAAMTR